MKKLYVLLVTLFLLSVSSYSQSSQSAYLIKAGKLYDSEKNIFLKDQEIYIQGNKISKVGQKLTVPANTPVIDLSNATVTPGLVDAHTHLLLEQQINENLAVDGLTRSGETRVLRAAQFARTYLNAGFTTIRDLGNSGYYLDVEVKKAINAGYIDGPRMYVSGPIISSTDGQFYFLPVKEQDKITKSEYRVIHGAEDARLAVKEHLNQFVNVIKILAQGERLPLSIEEMKAIVETAQPYGIKVTAHAAGDREIRNAIEAGVHGIEHAYSIEDNTLELMAKKGVYMVPTYPSLDYYIKIYQAQNIKDYKIEEIKKEIGAFHTNIQRAVKKGVTLVAGSDMYLDLKMPRGEGAKYTLLAYQEAGLSAKDILRTASYNAAIALDKKGQIGVIKENAFADLAVFNGDLEQDFKKALFDVQLVMKDGKIKYQK